MFYYSVLHYVIFIPLYYMLHYVILYRRKTIFNGLFNTPCPTSNSLGRSFGNTRPNCYHNWQSIFQNTLCKKNWEFWLMTRELLTDSKVATTKRSVVAVMRWIAHAWTCWGSSEVVEVLSVFSFSSFCHLVKIILSLRNTLPLLLIKYKIGLGSVSENLGMTKFSL